MIDNIKTINEDQGQTVSVVGGNYRIIISGEQTRGAYAVIDMLVPPGRIGKVTIRCRKAWPETVSAGLFGLKSGRWARPKGRFPRVFLSCTHALPIPRVFTGQFPYQPGRQKGFGAPKEKTAGRVGAKRRRASLHKKPGIFQKRYPGIFRNIAGRDHPALPRRSQ